MAHNPGACDVFLCEECDGLKRMAGVAVDEKDRPLSANGQPAGTDLLAAVRSGAWLDAQHFPPVRYAVDRLIPEGLVLIVGPPKIGKSYFVLDCGLAVAGGGCALGTARADGPRPVLYLALEDGDRRMQSRCRQLLDTERIPPAFEYLTRVEHGRVVETIQTWLHLHQEAGLVLIDTLGKVMPPAEYGESAYGRDYRVAARLKRLADDYPGLAVAVNHHDNKALHADFVHAVSGTNGLAGAADTVAVIKRSRFEPEGTLAITGRDVAEGEYAVRFERGHRWSLAGGSFDAAAGKAVAVRATAGVGDRMAEIIAYVSGRDEPVGPKQVGFALGMDGDTAGKHLRRAAEGDRLRKTGRGLYTPVRSVRESEPRVPHELDFGHSDTADTPAGGSDEGHVPLPPEPPEELL